MHPLRYQLIFCKPYRKPYRKRLLLANNKHVFFNNFPNRQTFPKTRLSSVLMHFLRSILLFLLVNYTP